MKRAALTLTLCLFFASAGVAQQAPADGPPTKDDIEKFFQVMHIRDTMKLMMDAGMKQARQMVREQLKKEVPDMTPEFMAQMDGMFDDMWKDFPMEEMLQIMVPVYQKHLTKGELDTVVAFYSSPVGQKLLKEMPAMTQEAMQASYGLMQKYMGAVMQKVRERVEQMQKDTKAKPAQQSSPKPM